MNRTAKVRQQANRGMGLERLIEVSNAQYAHRGAAVVQKIPTPTTVVREAGKIVGARHFSKSTVDFLGVTAPYGRTVAFDAKENREATRFPFDRRWAHEVAFLRSVDRAGGITFLLIEQVTEQMVYLMPGPVLFYLWQEAWQRNGRRSLSLDDLHRLPVAGRSTAVPVDYLAVIDKYWPRLWTTQRVADWEE
jgi:recombination protein U